MPALVLDSPHSGHDFPADFDAVVSERELRESEDCYVDELYAEAEEVGASLVAARVPRTYIDANRHAGDVDLDLIEGPWPWEYRPSGKARIGKSLIWRTLEDGRPIYARRLLPETVRRRIERVHVPYHRHLKEKLDEAYRRDARLIRDVIRTFVSDKYDSVAVSFLRREIGSAAIPYLEEVSKAKSTGMRQNAERLLGELRR